VSNKYDSYKDSGVEWIGEIPSHWDFFNLKFILREGVKDGPHETPIWFEEGIPFLSIDGIINGEISFEKCRFIDEEQFEKFSKKLIIEKDDIFIGKAASIGKIARVKTDRKFTVWSPIAVVKVKKEYNPVFVEYYFRSDIVQHQIELLSTSNTQKNIAMGDIPKMKFIAPSEEEQTTIANYLDQKTTEIDSLIAKKQNLIQLLEEERVAVIDQAVTKGLDPTVPMKDSGIEWLGEIPEHWELWKISHAFKRIGSGTTPESGNPIYHENGTINWLNTGDLNDGEVVSCNKKITEQAIFDYTSLKLFPAGSLVMAMYGATIGKTGIIKFDTTTNQACCVFCEGEIIDLKFLQYWFLAKKENIINLAIGGGQPNISQNILKDVRVNCPSITEQLSIVKYLDLKTKEIDLVKSKAYQEIELLKEYKTALISEVVTGKVDVRNEKLNIG
jgi:type I restriction enzyme S subunit